jgi:hypothetical protein
LFLPFPVLFGWLLRFLRLGSCPPLGGIIVIGFGFGFGFGSFACSARRYYEVPG